MQNAENCIVETLRLYSRHLLDTKTPKQLANHFVCEVLENINKFNELFELLVDDQSAEILAWAIKWRVAAFLTQSKELPSALVPPRISGHAYEQMLAAAKRLPEARLPGNLDIDLIENYILNGYALPGICEVGAADIVLDFGAYNGNSSIVFGRACHDGKVYAFEPNPTAHEILQHNINQMELKNVEVVPAGVADTSGKLRFRRAGATSRIDPTGEVEADIIRIDDFVAERGLKKIDFLKFDIEGTEVRALKGAVNTIRYFRPKIAISVYHLHDDLTTIPFMIKDIGQWYKFYLRHNAISGGEIVLYCVPAA